MSVRNANARCACWWPLLICAGSLAALHAEAQAPAELRVALVIGNAAYAAAPLATPGNDAKAMSETLRGLGFTVVEAHDASKADIEAALDKARDAMKGANAVGMLYYSGHALQHGWHNYLVPVDAKLAGPQDAKDNAFDVQRAIEAFTSSGNRVNIFVLDACRENPFSASASARGLAQMDAPSDTLLAYSAAPGEVADDADAGSGYGLYTQHLLRELKQPGAKVEDVFKRVRFQVRRQSQGRQVPWESTSLEGDFHFDPAFRSAQPGPETAARAAIAPAPAEMIAGNIRFVGSFTADADGAAYSGTGKVVWPNGDVFDGTLVAGKREGRGAFAWASGQRYEGDWRGGQPSGQGVIWFVNGDHYEGAVEAGLPHGQGHKRFASGDRYVGQLLKGIPSGRGAYIWPSGQTLVAEWVDGQARGSGTMRFANGDLYEGEIAKDQPNGLGRILFALSGDTYVGSFKQGRPDGLGTYMWKNGDHYVGLWKDALRDGPGVMTWHSGQRWEGSYRAGAMVVDGVSSAP